MTLSRYRVGILGCGFRGTQHAEAFRENADRFELVALCDLNEERLKSIAVTFPNTQTYADAEAMLAREPLDVFCFATLPQVRLPLVELGVKHGVKAIAFEKPMALSLAEAQRIRQVCADAGIQWIVSHQHKYGEHWRTVKAIADRGEIGKVHTIHATAKGWLLQYGTHLIDYVMFLNGGHRGQWVTGHIHGRGKLSDSHPSPDYACGQIGFTNGVRGIIECGELAPDAPGDNSFWMNAGVTIHGSEGYAQVIVGSGWRAVTKSSRGILEGQGGFDVKHDQPPFVRHLADWLDDPAKVHPCNGEISYHGFELLAGIVLSALDRRKLCPPIQEARESFIGRMRNELP